MRFDHVKARNIGPFRSVDIDISAIPGQLVAITGANGAGKSTFLELLAAGLYRQGPTRGTLAELATARDSMLEVSACNGSPYTLRHVVDALSKKGESVALDGAGSTLTEAGKVRELDAWAARHLPAPEVLYASTFAPQGSGGFLDLKPAARKAVLLRVLGVERLEVLAEEARRRATETQGRVRIAQARLDDERARTPDRDGAEEWLGTCRGELRVMAAELEAAEKAARDAERAAEAAERTLAQRAQLVEGMTRLDTEALEVERRREGAVRLAGRVDEVRVAREQLALTETNLVTARADLVRAREMLAAERQAETQRLADGERLRALRARESHLREAIVSHERDMARADEVEEAVAVLPGLEAAVESAQEEVTRCEMAVADLRETFQAGRLAAAETERATRAAGEQLKKLDAVLARQVHVQAAGLRREALAGAVVQAEAARSAAEVHLGELQSSFLASKDTRIACLRVGLEDVVEAGSDGITRPADEARRALEMDDARSADADAAPAAILAAQDCLRRSVERKTTLVQEHDALHDVPRQQAEIDAAQAEAPAALAAFEEVETRLRAAEAAVDDIRREGENARGRANQAMGALVEARDAAAVVRATASLAPAIARAQASHEAARSELAQIEAELPGLRVRAEYDHMDPGYASVVTATGAAVADLERQVTMYQDILADADAIAAAAAQVEAAQRDRQRIETALTELRGQLMALPGAQAVDVNLAHAAAQQATVAHQAAQRDLVAAEQQVEQARAGAERIADLEVTLTKELDEVSDWTRLGQDLGKDGIQALEVDAAGPELTAIANDLLHSCVSRRWTMEVRTQRASADGKRQLEGCDVVVIDTERGREGEAETFSGGERVLLGEALSLALSVLACRRHGVVGPTLVRDESGAALDASNGRAYIAMLRRAALLIGADKVLFVSHSAELQELADARIHVADGCATVIGGAS